MKLRLLFTFVILAGLAAAPNAQVFRWEPGRHVDRDRVTSRVHVALDRAQRAWERAFDRINRRVDARADRRARIVTRHARSHVAGFAEMQARNSDDPCANSGRSNDDYQRHCEVRESTMPAGPLNVDAGQNGGITVEAWDGNEIRVRSVVQGSAESADRAKALAGQVQVQAGGGRVYATGPDTGRREWWSVSYRISVPRKNDLDLHASNGGITISGVNGTMRFDTTNGGVKLTDVGGHVSGQTRNGGVTIMLDGDRWDGDGLDVETSNGGINLRLPEHYNAQLETRTVNGGWSVEFPITVQGDLSGRRGSINTTLGSGGPPVRVRTTNGGVKISRR